MTSTVTISLTRSLVARRLTSGYRSRPISSVSIRHSDRISSVVNRVGVPVPFHLRRFHITALMKFLAREGVVATPELLTLILMVKRSASVTIGRMQVSSTLSASEEERPSPINAETATSSSSFGRISPLSQGRISQSRPRSRMSSRSSFCFLYTVHGRVLRFSRRKTSSSFRLPLV